MQSRIAQQSTRLGTCVLVSLIVLTIPAVAQPSEANLESLSNSSSVTVSGVLSAAVVPSQVSQGGLVRVYAGTPEWVQQVQIRAELPSGVVQDTHAFFVRRASSGEKLWAALVGVPSTVSSGLASATVSARGRTSNVQASLEFSVLGREFVEEEIPLSGAMTSLRQDDSERRRRESLELASVLFTTDLGSRFHMSPFQLPMSAFRRSSFFGDRRTYQYSDGGQAGSIHNGVDYAAPIGEPIYAAGRGRVVMATERMVTGNTVVLEHLPGVYSLYYHLDSIGVRQGQVINTGTPIGTVGATGLVTGPHLHWEVRVSGVAIEPETLTRESLIDIEAAATALSVRF